MTNHFEADGRKILPPKIPDGLPPLAAETLRVALAEYGVKETPGRKNRGPRVDEYVRGVRGNGGYLLGAPWCGRFARWAVDEAAANLHVASPLIEAGDLASWSKWHDWALITGRLRATAEPGRIAILHDPAKAYGHLYLVVDTILGENYTVEGNAGDMVDCRARDASKPIGYVSLE